MMKRILSIILLVSISTFSWAGPDDFEGNITFGIDLEGTGTDMLKAMLPNNYVYVIKEKQMLFKMQGGMVGGMIGEVVINANDGNHYMVKHSEQTAYKIEEESVNKGNKMAEDIKITPMDETLNILGYKCKKYKVTVIKDGVSTDQFIWATPDITVSGQNEVGSDLSGNIFYEGVKGFPLKVETTINKMGMSFKMIMTATDVLSNTVESSIFSIPSSYKVEKFSPSAMGGF